MALLAVQLCGQRVNVDRCTVPFANRAGMARLEAEMFFVDG